MGAASCARALNLPVQNCANGCLDDICCTTSKCGTSSHHCLSQLLKRLDVESTPSDTCGKCFRKVKEPNE